jgi:nucleoside-diphosphate-sugar epimerase
LTDSPLPRRHLFEEDLRTIAAEALPWKTLAGKTVLVTGANGFLASCLVETLLWINDNFGYGNKINVIALVRSEMKAVARFGEKLKRNDLRLLVQDVCTPITGSIEATHIIHAASQASPKYYGPDPVGTLSPNTVGTHHLLEFAQRKQS